MIERLDVLDALARGDRVNRGLDFRNDHRWVCFGPNQQREIAVRLLRLRQKNTRLRLASEIAMADIAVYSLKIAVVAPMPGASETIASAVNAVFMRSMRTA